MNTELAVIFLPDVTYKSGWNESGEVLGATMSWNQWRRENTGEGALSGQGHSGSGHAVPAQRGKVETRGVWQ